MKDVIAALSVKSKRIFFFFLKGRNLSRRITDASLEYQKLYNKWSSIDFDPLETDVTTSSFKKIQKEYQHKADTIERALAQIFIEAFDDCYSTQHCFQVDINIKLI